MSAFRARASLVLAAAAALCLPFASPAGAASAPACPGGSVCFYSGENFHGKAWEWTANSGYRDLPPSLHDHVGSFVASTDACFIAYQPTEKRLTHNGDWRSAYAKDFGGRMDGVAPGHC
ncbi:peptidase inhibitor family I36 protein [Streptomyces sp. URMC 124]|uniref:peptidase inhibitor family I36 protein n=1 Tax=Streptomyces sp. URMC 124 TaxID=3423405 RepID=UPI003F1DF40C